MQPPIVALIRSRQAKMGLKAVPCELHAVSSIRQLAREKAGLAPRLSIVEAAAEPDRFTEVLGLLRNTWPLADIVVWAPKAPGSLVRSAFRAGAKDVVVSSRATQLSATVQQLLDRQQFLPLSDELAEKRARGSRFESMLSRNNAMWDLFALCGRVAPSGATILIVGETGTGKELLARAIHNRSGRSGRFVATNCASLPPQLIESELFGHEKGAFTGAHGSKTGLVRHAHEGTLFLDEIGDMPESTQTSLLRLLQDNTIRPVGGQDEIAVDVRIVAATHVPLDEAVANGDLREDLFYRLDVIRMNLPPLRERPEDVVYLFGYCAKRLSKHYGLPQVRVSDDFLGAMSDFDWPGNVRQLENFAERVVLASPQRRLGPKDFARIVQQSTPTQTTVRNRGPVTQPSLAVDIEKPLEEHLDPLIKRFEREYFAAVLQAHNGKIAESAEHAGISRRTLLRKMKALNIDKADFKAPAQT